MTNSEPITPSSSARERTQGMLFLTLFGSALIVAGGVCLALAIHEPHSDLARVAVDYAAGLILLLTAAAKINSTRVA